MNKLMQGCVGGVMAVAALSAQAQSVEIGKKAYHECIACHAVEKGVNGVGPTLFGIVGSKAGEVPKASASPAR